MADWDDDEWEASAANFKPAAPASTSKAAAEYETKGQAILAGATEPDMSRFADEDAELDEGPKHTVVAPQPKKKEEKKYTLGAGPVEQPLDDPVAEKLRQQRLVEQADFAAAKELFGDAGLGLNLDTFLPKSVKDFEDFAQAIVSRYVLPHRDNKNFKLFIKNLAKASAQTLTSTEVKDVETSLAGLRSDKLKAETAAAKAKTTGKKQLNMGKQGDTGGLDDYVYDDAGGDDGYDFM